MRIYYITIYIHICTHICYVLYRLITCLNLSIFLYIVRTCNICPWHVTILGSPVAPHLTWFKGGPWPYGDTPVWVLTKGGVEIPERLKGNWANSWHSRCWLNSFFLVRYAEHFGFILQLLHVQKNICIRKSSKMTRPSWFCRLWCSWSMQFRNRCAPYGPYIVSKVLYKLSFIRTLEWC